MVQRVAEVVACWMEHFEPFDRDTLRLPWWVQWKRDLASKETSSQFANLLDLCRVFLVFPVAPLLAERTGAVLWTTYVGFITSSPLCFWEEAGV